MADSRDPHRAEREAEKQQRYRDAMVDLDTGNTTHLTTDAVVACPLCDDRGYRGHLICDHIDRTQTNATGIAKVRDALAKARQQR